MILKNLGFVKKAFNSLTPAIPMQGFAIRTTQATTLRKEEILPQFSRAGLKKANETPDLETLARMKAEEEKKLSEKRWFENQFNDKNPSNLVKVKFNVMDQYKTNNETLPSSQTEPTLSLNKPYVVLIQPRAPKIIAHGIRRRITCRIKKMLMVTKRLQGLHVYDALNTCMNLHTKAAKYCLYTLQMVKRHAVEKGMDEERLFVSEVITGKQRRTRGIRYHAKGKAGMMTHDIIQLKIKLEEKPLEDIYKNILQGKFSPVFAYSMRNTLLSDDADYETIRKYQYLLTAKGRQQRKLMFKRQVLQRYLELKEKGVMLTKKVIFQKMLNEEAIELADIYRSKRMGAVTSAFKDRQEMFKKNEENTAL